MSGAFDVEVDIVFEPYPGSGSGGAFFPPPVDILAGVTTASNAYVALGLTGPNVLGLVVGNPTLGNKGPGTINATAIFVNGNAVGGGLSVPTSVLIGGNGSNLTSVAVDGTSLAVTSNTLGVNPLTASKLFGNPTGATAVPSAIAIGSGLAFSGTTLNPTGLFTTNVNITSGSFLQQNGVMVFNAIPGLNNTFVGVGTGSAVTSAASCVFVGLNAGLNVTVGGENTFVGNAAGQFMTSGGQGAAFGDGAMWHETAPFCCSFGSDNYRDWITMNGFGANTSFGFASLIAGGGYQNTVVGALSLQGNSACIRFSGTPNPAGETIPFVWTGSFTGSPYTINVVIPASQTLVQAVAVINAAFNADTTLNAAYPTGLQLAAGLGVSSIIAATATDLLIRFGGTGTSGQSTVITVGTGSFSTGVAITNGMVGFNNIVLGYQSMVGNYATSAANNFFAGTNIAPTIITGTNNIAIGLQAAGALTYGNNNFLAGQGAGFALTGSIGNAANASNNVAIGISAMASSVLGGGSIAIGNSAMRFYNGTQTSGNQTNVVIGYNAAQGTIITSYFANVIIGGNAGLVLQTGNSNVMIGANAGSAMTTGASNVFIGSGAGVAQVTTQGSILIGINSGQAATGQNIMIGANAGKIITSGLNNIVIGPICLTAGGLTTGGNNLLIGTGASTVETAATNTHDTININNIFLASGTNTFATSLAGVAGSFAIGGLTGPTWSTGAGAPSANQPVGSLYSNTTGALGARLYVSAGGGTWTAVAAV